MKTSIKIGQTKVEMPEIGIKVVFGDITMETEISTEELVVLTQAQGKNLNMVMTAMSTLAKWATSQFIKVDKEIRQDAVYQRKNKDLS